MAGFIYKVYPISMVALRNEGNHTFGTELLVPEISKRIRPAHQQVQHELQYAAVVCLYVTVRTQFRFLCTEIQHEFFEDSRTNDEKCRKIKIMAERRTISGPKSY